MPAGGVQWTIISLNSTLGLDRSGSISEIGFFNNRVGMRDASRQRTARGHSLANNELVLALVVLLKQNTEHAIRSDRNDDNTTRYADHKDRLKNAKQNHEHSVHVSRPEPLQRLYLRSPHKDAGQLAVLYEFLSSRLRISNHITGGI